MCDDSSQHVIISDDTPCTIKHSRTSAFHDVPNFDLGLDSDFNMDVDDDVPGLFDKHSGTITRYDAPNFDLGLDSDFDMDVLHSDSDFDNDSMEQEGYAVYTLTQTTQRRIPKFNVYGWEYRLSVPALDRNLTYLQVVQMLHGLFEQILQDMLRGVEPHVSM